MNFKKITIEDNFYIDKHIFWASELSYFDPEYDKKRELARLEHILEDPYGEENWI